MIITHYTKIKVGAFITVLQQENPFVGSGSFREFLEITSIKTKLFGEPIIICKRLCSNAGDRDIAIQCLFSSKTKYEIFSTELELKNVYSEYFI